MSVTFPGGLTYTPGQRQALVITVTDSTARGFGFQLSARLASNTKTQAGTFSVSGNAAFVLCSSTDFTRQSDKGATCPAAQPLEFAEHTTPLRAPSNTWTVQWDPPADASAGNVVIYVAGNAANLNGQETGDRIFTANYTLAPAGATPRPTIADGGIIQAGAFGASKTVASGSWIEIFGSNFSSTTGDWGSGFNGSNAPTTTNGVSVTVGGKAAFISFVSPTQINAQVPADVALGQVPVIVKNAAGESTPQTITVAARAPGLLSPPAFLVNGRQYLAALHTDGAFVGPVGFIPGITSRPAKEGDVIVTYGVGFGAVSPPTAPGVITPASPSNALPNLRWRFGDIEIPASSILYGGLAPNFVGLYQFNIRIPGGVSGGVPLTVTTDGVPLTQTLAVSIQ